MNNHAAPDVECDAPSFTAPSFTDIASTEKAVLDEILYNLRSAEEEVETLQQLCGELSGCNYDLQVKLENAQSELRQAKNRRFAKSRARKDFVASRRTVHTPPSVFEAPAATPSNVVPSTRKVVKFHEADRQQSTTGGIEIILPHSHFRNDANSS